MIASSVVVATQFLLDSVFRKVSPACERQPWIVGVFLVELQGWKGSGKGAVLGASQRSKVLKLGWWYCLLVNSGSLP